MRTIVTGGAGFIGSALCRHLIQSTTHTILNLDKLTYAANLASLDPIADNHRYQLKQLDICDLAKLRHAVTDFKPDLIFHLAAETHVDRSINGAADFIQTNLIGTFNVLEVALNYWQGQDESARKTFRLVHVSTDEVYGTLGSEGLFSETTAYDPSSPYSASKAGADHLASAWHRTYGLPVIITNCSNNYGPFQFPEKLIPLMILKAMKGEPLPVYGDGSNVRDWLHVEDHVAALELVAAKGQPGETYAIGGGNERTNLDIVEAICDYVGQQGRPGTSLRDLITFVKDRPGHDQRYAIDASKIEAELGWRTRRSFDQGLESTIEWYLAHQNWWQPILDGVYGGQRLGLQNIEQIRPTPP